MIRPATTDDVPALFDLIRELADYEKLTHEVTGSAEALAADLFGAAPSDGALVAISGGSVVGYALFFPIYSTFRTARGMHLEDLYVTPDHRGKGLGRALLLGTAAQAVATGCARLDWNVLDWNISAIGFYAALGAPILPDWRVCRLEGEALARAAARAAILP